MTIKQLGGVFGRNPTFNNVTIEGTLTFDGDIDINSDLTISGNLYLPDNSKAIFGDGSDLQIYHDGTDSRIDEVGGNRLILRSSDDIRMDKYTGENMGVFNADGSVDLYYDAVKKFETTATGIDVTGSVTADGLTVQSGVADIRAGNIGPSSNASVNIGRADTSIASGNPLGYVQFLGSDNTAGSLTPHAYIGAIASSTHSAGSNPTEIVFGTTATSSETILERLKISDNGDVSFYEDTGTTPKMVWSSAAEKLTLSGAGGLYVGAGSAGDPSIKMNDVNSGLFAPSGNVVAISAGGGERFRATTAGIAVTGDITLGDTNPTITFEDSSITNLSHTVSSASDNLRLTVDVNGVDAGSRVEIFDGSTEVARFSAGAMDVTGSVTADGLTVDTSATGGLKVEDRGSSGTKITSYQGTTNSNVRQLDLNGYKVSINTGAVTGTTVSERVLISDNGDISFYEDTGTTPKFFWDSSAESLGIGTSSPQKIHGGASLDGETSTGFEFIAGNNTVSTVGGEFIGGYVFRNNDSSGTPDHYSGIRAVASDSFGSASLEFYGGRDDYEVGTSPHMTIRGDTNAALNGNVGIGTSSPTAPLHVFGGGILGANATNPIAFTGSGGTNAGIGSYTANSDFNVYSAGTGNIKFVTGAAWSSAGVLTTVGSEAMRIDSSGNLLVGTTDTDPSDNSTNSTADDGVAITAVGEVRSSRYLAIANSGAVGFFNRTGTDGDIVRLRKSGTTVGSISVTASATAYNTSSDQRLKENIADADDAGAKIDSIQVRKFDWKADGSHQDYGMVAQELLEVAPEAVSAPEDPEEMMGVDYSKLVPMMLKEIQSLRARVAQLES